MSAANGFVTTRPDAQYGDTGTQSSGTAYVRAQKFTAGGSGTQEITRVGVWASRSTTTAHTVTFAIYTHDAANNCPDVLVADSQSTPVDLPNGSFVEVTYAYSGTLPQVTGGATYWLVVATEAGTTGWFSRFASGGDGVSQVDTFTYPTLPTGDAWHTHTNSTTDWSLYAVYQAEGEPEPPATGTVVSALTLLGVG